MIVEGCHEWAMRHADVVGSGDSRREGDVVDDDPHA